MIDLLMRLRSPMMWGSQLALEAAGAIELRDAEITRLREEVAHWRQAYNDALDGGEILRIENAALRARLAEPERGPMSGMEIDRMLDALPKNAVCMDIVRAVERHHGIS